MSIYSELSQQYKRSFDKQQTKLHIMADAANDFALGFEQFIEVPSATWTDSEGKQQRYVRLGTGDERSFQERSFLELSALDGVVHFSIAITVEQGPGLGIRQIVIFKLSAELVEGSLQIVAKDLQESLTVEFENRDRQRFSPIYAALVAKLMSMFDPSRV